MDIGLPERCCGGAMDVSASPLFVGRADELAVIGRCLETVRAGCPAVILVEGEAGIGKTALIRRGLSGAALDGFSVLRAFCDDSERDYAFGVVSQLIQRLGPLQDDFPLLGMPISSGAAPLPVGAQLLALVGRLQERGPVALVIDDLQWADQRSLQALGFVIRRLEFDSVLVVLTARNRPWSLGASTEVVPDESLEEAYRWVGSARAGFRVQLTGLDTANVRHWLDATVEHQLDDRLAQRLREHTEGHPLFTETVLTELKDLDDGRNALPVPKSLGQGVRQQLDALPPPSRRLVEAIAVLGGRQPIALAAALAACENPAADLEPALHVRLVRWWPDEVVAHVSINHELQRQTILQATDPVERCRLHAAAADLVDREAAWGHRVAAVSGPDQVLARQLEEEAERRLPLGDTERAARMLRWASDISATRSEHERLLLSAASWLIWHGKLTSVTPLLESVRACADSPLRDLTLGAYAAVLGERAQAVTQLGRAFDDAARVRGQEWIAAMAGFWLGNVYVYEGKGDEMAEVSRRVLRLPDIPPVLAGYAKVWLSFGIGFKAGARAALEEIRFLAGLPDTPKITDPANAVVVMYRGCYASFAGDLAAGAGDLKMVLKLARSEYPFVAEWASADLASVQFTLGEWDDAVINCHNAMNFLEAERKVRALSFIHSIAAWVPSMRGEWATALDHITVAEHGLPDSGPRYRVQTAVSRALLGQAQANYPAMLEALQPILDMPPDSGPALYKSWWLPLYAEALLANGHLPEAHEALSELQRLVHEIPYLHVVCARLTGQLAENDGRPERAADHYQQALEQPVPPDDAPLHRALLEQATGRLLARTGRPAASSELLERAASRLTELRAAPFLERCRQDIAKAGVATTNGRREEPSGLTGRERDIAHLARQGMTNREIASELFISVKTVEYHLGHVYQKLSVSSRRQLRTRAW
ncbi:AAA family ATPase [Kitasatospora sp. NPDC048540]|uniref:helix-turn-helix transcriptional regulator n=1 Tax=Kitasatospora sp. NPDC048540 TaxID=3155634 RepID=UPI0033E9B5D3